MEELLLPAFSSVGAILLAMQSSEVELSAAHSPFWALLALLRREPGMGWLPRGLGGCAGSWGPSGVEDGSRGQAGECGPGGSAVWWGRLAEAW